MLFTSQKEFLQDALINAAGLATACIIDSEQDGFSN